MKTKTKNFRKALDSEKIYQPEIKYTKLENGLTIISERIPFFNSFALGIGIKVGSRNDYEGKEGISHLLEHCVFRRSKNYESKQINELFEKYGAYANAFTTKEYTVFYVRALNQYLGKVWNLLSEIVFDTNFDNKDLAKEKSIVKEEIRSYNEDPEEEIFDLTDRYLFKNSRLSHPIVGRLSSVDSIDIDTIYNFYHNFYLPSNSAIVYIGALEHKEILELIDSALVSYKYKESITTSDRINIQQNVVNRKFKRHFLQSHISLSRILPSSNPKQRYLAAIANLLLGDCSSSRLYKAVREKCAYVYNVFSMFTSYSDCSAIYIYSTTHPQKQAKTIDKIRKELKTLYKFGFNESELYLAKEQIKSTTIMALENYSERMQAILKSELTYGKYETLKETLEIIDSINLDELNNFVLENFEPSLWSQIVFEPK
jgi:predicted Zn-dependent peptidase